MSDKKSRKTENYKYRGSGSETKVHHESRRENLPRKEKSRTHRSSSNSSKASSSSNDSDNSNSSINLLEKLKKERLKETERKIQQKELLKATETAEEKRIRRLKKKEAKERRRKERMGWDNEYLHYTNTDNPFGDGNLLNTFVWSKKLSKDGLSNASREEIEMRNRFKQEENKRELEKVKKRRQERELERQQREDEMLLLQRNKEAAQFEEWERQEDQFHLEQARLRSHIRIQDGRAKPIDLLAKYINAEEEVDTVEMHEPYTYLNGLQIKDLEDLVEDIKVYQQLERGRNHDYWTDITVIVDDELQKLRKQHCEYDAAVIRREGIHQSVAQDVTSVFRNKSTSQLEALQQQIEDKISGKADGIDIGYWESLLSQLKAHMARASLRDRHQKNLRTKLQLLKAEQAVTASTSNEAKVENTSPVASTSKSQEAGPSTSAQTGDSGAEASPDDSEVDESADILMKECIDAYETGCYSPKLFSPSELEPGTIVVLEEDDLKRLQFARLQVTSTGKKMESTLTKEELELQKEARKGMGEDEVQFSVEASVENQIYLWSDKYRPRKPRYFNRVHTGFEWNKYNQTHYDMDNPPPKIVQGYKFNIFYPDLIEKNSTPEYFLTPCPENREFAILRFHAGPPYEDIAFKIVNREWEYSYKRGFRCQFHNNIFQLWFHFKRYRYRR